MAARGSCESVHEESLALGELEFRVFRCSWGWCVKRGDAAFRSRMLLEAFEKAWGTRADEPLIRKLVGTIERALEAEHARKQRTVATTMSLPELH